MNLICLELFKLTWTFHLHPLKISRLSLWDWIINRIIKVTEIVSPLRIIFVCITSTLFLSPERFDGSKSLPEGHEMLPAKITQPVNSQQIVWLDQILIHRMLFVCFRTNTHGWSSEELWVIQCELCILEEHDRKRLSDAQSQQDVCTFPSEQDFQTCF